MKRTTIWIVTVILVIGLFLPTGSAASENRICAEPVTAEAGEDIFVPIRIENNAGFMGFALVISYNAEALRPISVGRGAVLSGMFDDSIAAEESGTFRVLFSTTQDCKTDGVLCTVKFHVLENASGKEKIGITYSPDDTFNEQWQPVELHCEDVQLVITQNGTTAPDVSEPETEVSELQTEEPATEAPTESTTVIQPEPEPIKDSARLRTWFKSLPTGIRVLLAGFIYPAIWILSIMGR